MICLAFGAHPDDVEVLMGGTLAKMRAKGYESVIVLVSSGHTKNEGRLEESRKAAEVLGAELLYLAIDPYDLYFNRRLVERFDEAIATYNPNIVFTHWIGDSHNDHQVVTNGVLAAARRNTFSVLMYEQAFPGGITHKSFRPQVIVDITEYIDVKIKSVLQHRSQIAEFTDKWIEGIKGRASYYGFLVGCEYAEAFEVVKLVNWL